MMIVTIWLYGLVLESISIKFSVLYLHGIESIRKNGMCPPFIMRRQVDITLSKNQVLQILYLV